jgi:hypothetical protein
MSWGKIVIKGKILKNKSAQAATEYIILLACIALACVAGSKIFHLALLQCYKNFVFMLSIPIP